MSDQLTEALTEMHRSYSDWGSIRGIKSEILPWKLYDKAKKLVWDPADIDFSKDKEQWNSMGIDQRVAIYGLATGFMIGEEGVTLDILPLVLATADEGRTEETFFLTTFLFEEAKHVDFFQRWFSGVGIDIAEMDEIRLNFLKGEGIEPLTPERRHFMFQVELPRVMRRLLTDRSAEAFLDASVTYNQFVEGCLAIAGYKIWSEMFSQYGVLPGLQEGLELVQRDERRHIAYGTYLCRRLLSANPELVGFATGRMRSLLEAYFTAMRIQGYSLPSQAGPSGNGQGNEAPQTPSFMTAFLPFIDYVMKQTDRRVELLQKAAGLSAEEVETGAGVEEQEAEMQTV